MPPAYNASHANSAQNDFYHNLPEFKELSGFASFDEYYSLPDGWVVIIADVVGSTQAIKRGEYRSVNMLGAAVIAAVKNVSNMVHFPFQFGGDGASLCVPENYKVATMQALIALQAHSERIYGLNIRLGAFGIGGLRAQNCDVKVRKYSLSPNNHIAFFSGGGIELADDWLKHPPPSHLQEDVQIIMSDAAPEGEAPPPPVLSGLSCRWSPLKSQKGVVLSLIIKPLLQTTDSAALEQALCEIFLELSQKLKPHLLDFSPVRHENLKLAGASPYSRIESRMEHTGLCYYVPYYYHLYHFYLRLKLRFMMFAIENKFNMMGVNSIKYVDEVVQNSDFIKYDGVLRMVLDVRKDQASIIEKWLEDGWQQRKLIYGIHPSSQAVMTCLVEDLKSSEHVHFIDGDDGGLTLASVGFKAKLAVFSKESQNN